jgi:hypothetical protein
MRQEAPQTRQNDTYRNAENVQMNGATSLVKVTGGKIELATISGGGNSNWSAKDSNLFIGGLATYD